MNNFVITKNILNEIYDDKTFKNAVSELLNSLIDSELQKEAPDFDFIDECVNVLIEVQSDDFSGVIPFIARNKTDSEGKSRKTLGIFLACAVVFSLSLGALAVNHTIEMRKEKEKEAQTTLTTEQTTVTTTVTTEATTTKKAAADARAVELRLSFSDSFRSEYATPNDLNFDGVIVNVDYSDGTSKTIDISDCKITKDLNDYIGKITVEYKGLSDSYFVTFSESDVPGFTVEPLFPFGEGVYDPHIEVSSSHVTVGVGQSISVPMRKSTNGFVSFTVDNDIFDDINISYHGGVGSSSISLEITAGNTPGIATVSLSRSGDPENVLATVTVEVVAGGESPDVQ